MEEEVIEVVEEVVAEPVKTPEIDIKKVMEELNIYKTQNEEYKSLIDVKDKNFRETQDIIKKMQGETEALKSIANENEDWKKKVQEFEKLNAQQTLEAEKTEFIKNLKEKDSQIETLNKRLNDLTQDYEFKDYKIELMEKYKNNPVVADGIRKAKDKGVVQFILETYDKQDYAEMAKLKEIAGANAFEGTQTVTNEVFNWDREFDKINAEKGMR